MAIIVVKDLNDVTVDGAPSGSVTDVLTNYKNVAGIRGDLLNALQAWKARLKDAHAAALADCQANAAKLQSLVDVLGGTDEGLRLAREARRQAALDAQATAAAELAAIDAETP